MQLKPSSLSIVGMFSLVWILIFLLTDNVVESASLKENVFQSGSPISVASKRQHLTSGNQSSINIKITEKPIPQFSTEVSKDYLVRKPASRWHIGNPIPSLQILEPEAAKIKIKGQIISESEANLSLTANSTQSSNHDFQNRKGVEKLFNKKNFEFQKKTKSATAAGDQLEGDADLPVVGEAANEIDVLNNEEHQKRNRTNLKSSSEIVSLKSKPAKFLKMLKDAQESEDFEDPFSISSFFHGDTYTKNILSDAAAFRRSKLLQSKLKNSSEDEVQIIHPLVISSFQPSVRSVSKREKIWQNPSFSNSTSEEDDRPTTNSIYDKFLPTKTYETILVYSINDSTTEENSRNITSRSVNGSSKIKSDAMSSEYFEPIKGKGDSFREVNNVSDTIPIYEELTGILHVDTSIDDVQDYDIHLKFTENSDKIFPQINSSRTILLDPSIINFKIKTDSDGTPKDKKEGVVQGDLSPKPTVKNLQFSPQSKFNASREANLIDSVLNNTISPHSKMGEKQNTTETQISLDAEQGISNKSTNFSHLNNAYSNFVKEKAVLRVRTSEVETGVGGESARGRKQKNTVGQENSKDESYPVFFGYNSNWSVSRSKNDSDPLFISNHNEKVLELQAGRMLQVMNPNADPCDDFYEYACGKWSEVYPLQDKALDNTFDRLREGLDEVLRSLLQEPIAETDTYSTKAAKQLYNGCMSEEKIEERGVQPLKTMLKQLGGWPVLEGKSWNDSAFDWVKLMGILRTYNNDILLSEWVAADITNSSYHIIQLDQPELGLPGREYFISIGDEAYRMAYLDLMLQTCSFLNGDPKICLEDMLNVMQFEKQLAKILTPAEERRNLSAVSQRLTLPELQGEIPEINWSSYFSIVAGDSNNYVEEVIVFAMKYIKKLVTLIQSTRKRTVSNYLLWRFVKNRISNLGQEALKAKQEFIHVLFGSKSQPERWLSCVSYVNGNLGYVVGSMFVKKYYPQSSKNDSEEMIKLIRESFLDAVRNATWMAESTRKIAEEKVLAMVRNVGYPEYILDDIYMDLIHSELAFNESEHFSNVIQMLQFHARSTHKLLLKPVNRTEWTTTPAVVNAYYSRSKNMIMFPAGILQPPFYHPSFPRSLNFGGIGVVIGHEISHGFDDRGRQFDEKGNLQQWWTEEDVSHFYDKATCMLDQYGEYTVSSVGLRINAVNTLGENIADNAGLKIAYEAYQRWKKTNLEEIYKLNYINLTNDQLFFLNFGQIWCEVNSPEAMLTKIRGGQHSPNRFRVIGTLSNSVEFNEAFMCPKGAKMNREEKCKVW